jgi:hypothetical protein
MIVDNLILGNKTYRVSTADCDQIAEGNQGYLPFTLIALKNILGYANSHISVGAILQNGGPGGGGGGGSFEDVFITGDLYNMTYKGGDGFTGGGIGGENNLLGGVGG